MNTNLASVSTEGGGRFLGIKSINASEEDFEMLKKVMGSNVSDWVKQNKLKQVLGSWCILCGGTPTQIATYDCVGATRIGLSIDITCISSIVHLQRKTLFSTCPS